jgi:hypothetical protein
VRAAEDAGRYAWVAAVWKALGDPGQELRCLVAELERAGRIADLAAVLEQKGRLERAANEWRRAGHSDDVIRCEALLAEKKWDLEAAAALWERIGESRKAAHARAVARWRNQDYEEAAVLFEAAGETVDAVTARILAAKLRLDYDGAVRVLELAGMTRLRGRLLGRRDQWLKDARWIVEEQERRHVKAPRRANPKPRPQQSLFGPATETGKVARTRFKGTTPAAPEADAATPSDDTIRFVLETVRDNAGRTCEQIAMLADLDTAQVKPLVKRLVEEGVLRKVGKTRGTRYFLTGDRGR